MSRIDGANLVSDQVPLPPPALRHRVGDTEDYMEVGLRVRDDLCALLPPDWSFEGKRVLDFGCGAGRVLRHFLTEAQAGEFHGCDIDGDSIEWLRTNLCPPLVAFNNGNAPPLPRSDGYFDLIWATSVFTQITDYWSAWLLELHRVLKADGLLIATFLGPGMYENLTHEEWDADRIGMHVLGYGQPWDEGGPLVFLSPWWITEHWGRAFEILDLRESGFGNPDDTSSMQGAVLLRRKPQRPTQAELERIHPEEERELAALSHNIRRLHAESQMFHDLWQSSRSTLHTVENSRSWRITRPLRTAGALTRGLRSRTRPALPPSGTVPTTDGTPVSSSPRALLPNPSVPGAHRSATLSTELASELERTPAWMYPWSLAPGADAPLMHPGLPSVHATRAEMIEPAVRAALAQAGPNATALDLACSEGYFAQRLLEWGAHRVVGIDVRAQNVLRATLIADHFGIDQSRLSFRQGDVFELVPETLGRFDVVLLLGLIYHVEDPVGVVRLARRLTRSLCVVESQLTRQDAPIIHGQGVPDVMFTADGSFAAVIEEDAEQNPLASAPGILSLIPNRAALELMIRTAGFGDTQIVEAAAHHNPQYLSGDRAVALARP